MNKLKLAGYSFAIGCALLGTSCSDDITTTGNGSGRIRLAVDLSTSLLSSRSAGVEYTDVTAADLSLRLTSEDGKYVKEWDKIADFKSDEEEFKIGNYTLEVYYGDVEDEDFESPYFYGSSDLRIRYGETTPVGITANLHNAMVRVAYTDAFANYMTAYSAQLHSAGGKYITFTADETRPAYVKPGEVELTVNCTKPNGKDASLKVATVEAQAQYSYTIVVDIEDGAGAPKLVVTFDDALETEPVEIELSDELFAAAAPELTLKGFESNIQVNHVSNTDLEADEAYVVDIYAQGGLAEVNLTTVSSSLRSIGWPSEINLIAATAAQQATLTEGGLSVKGLWRNPDKMAIVDLSNIIPNLKYVDGGNNVHTFTLNVVDRNGKTSEPVILKVSVAPISVEIAQGETSYVGDTTLKLNVTYNGRNIDDLKFQFKNSRGTWTTATVESTTLVSDEDCLYSVTVNIPSDALTSPITIRAVAPTKTSEEIEINQALPDVTVQAADTFATYTLVSVKNGNTVLNQYATLYVSEDDANYTAATQTAAGDALKVSGLKAGTKYYIKASLSGDVANASDAITVTTEAATQLPNASMEDWYTVSGESKYWWTEYPGTGTDAVWGTMNQLTTSQGGSSSVSRNSQSYAAYSGTRVTTDSKSGNAAIIETVGWGKGNQATGSCSSNTCKNITAGQLYLGNYNSSNQTANYGYAWTTRPAGMTFWYKYTAKNAADYGYAEITVLNTSGEVIATATKQLTSAGSYQQVTLPLSYATTAKAAQIKVVFKSSDNSACLSASNDNMSSPGFANMTDGRFTGSSLYIDEITLNY